jgi:hypothetical protein
MGSETTVGEFRSEKDRLIAQGYDCSDLSMSNFDHTADMGLDAALRGGKLYAPYAGWNFHGTVWWDGERFACEVWVYGSPREVIRADTLEDIMESASDKYGWQ